MYETALCNDKQCLRNSSKCEGRPINCEGKPSNFDGERISCEGKPGNFDGEPIHCDGKPSNCERMTCPIFMCMQSVSKGRFELVLFVLQCKHLIPLICIAI